MNTIVDGINITYPDLGFAFNPIRVFVGNLNGTMILEANGVKIERELNEGQNEFSFELSAIAKSLFNRLEFYKTEQTDTTLFKRLSFTLTGKGTSFKYEGSIPVIWGALQIGEIYTQNKTLTYFKGFPFTVPLYTEGKVVLKVNGIEYKTIEAGKHNIDISPFASSGVVTIEAFDEFHRKVFDYTFDYTFGPQRVLISKGLNIRINVVDCPNDGVYLRWINKYGEYNYYLFQSSGQSVTTKSNAILYDNIIYTTALTDNYHYGTGKSIGKGIEQTNKLFASLVDQITFDMLLSIAESPVVDMFAGYAPGGSPQWISVSVADGSFAKTTSPLQDFELFLVPNTRQVQIL